jgi:hypothetical protein
MMEEDRIDWLEKFLGIYEEGANRILNVYEGRADEILKYYWENPFGDRKKLKSANQILNCRHILWRCDRLRSFVSQNNLRSIVYDVAWLGTLSYNAGLSKIVSSVLGRIRGGKATNTNEKLVLIVQEAFKKSKRKTASGLWNYLKLKYREEIGGISFIDMDDPYWRFFKAEGILISKKKRAKRQYLDITKEKFVPYNTFKRYVSGVKKMLEGE